jgi:hypothetical protein
VNFAKNDRKEMRRYEREYECSTLWKASVSKFEGNCVHENGPTGDIGQPQRV